MPNKEYKKASCLEGILENQPDRGVLVMTARGSGTISLPGITITPPSLLLLQGVPSHYNTLGIAITAENAR